MAPSQKKIGKRDVRAAAPTAQRAVDYLHEQGETDYAKAVTTLLEYATAPASTSYGDPSFPLYFDRALRDRVNEASEAAKKASGKTKGESGEEKQDLLTTTVLDGFEKVLAGEWEPPQPGRARRGSGPDKVNTSIRVPADLAKQVDDWAEEYAREQGWSMVRGSALTARRIAVAYLEYKFPPPEQQQAAE